MGAFNRLLDRVREPVDPIRTIGPVNPREGLLSSPQAAPQAAPQAPRESLLDYMNQWGAYTPMEWQSIAPQLAQLGIDPKGQDGARGWQYNGGNPQHDAGGDAPLWSLTPDAQAKLQGYTLGGASQLDRNAWQRQVYDPSGQAIGQSNEDRSRSMAWIEAAVPMALSAMGANALGPVFGGGTMGGALSGATSSGLVASATGGDVGKAILMGGLGGGLNGYMQGGGGGLDPFTPDALDAWGKGAGVGVPDWESAIGGLGQSAGGSIPSFTSGLGAELQASIANYANSLTPQQIPMPDVASLISGAQSFPVAPQSTPSWLDQVPAEIEQSLQQASQQTPAQVNSTMPDVSAIPQTLPTTGLSDFRKSELDGYQTDGRLPTSPAIPAAAGGLLDSLKGMGGSAIDWMKANPALAKTLLSVGSGLLSSQGGGSSSGAPKQYGAPVQWKSPVSPIPQGLLGGQTGQSGGQSPYPAAMGLLGGQPNSGAWRFLR